MWALEHTRATCAQWTTLLFWRFGRLAPLPTRPSHSSGSVLMQGTAVARAARAGAIASVAVLSLPALLLAVLFGTQAVSAWALPQQEWQARLRQMLRPPVYDATGQILGFIPPPGATDLEARYAADPGPIPKACIDLVLAREDAHHASWWRHVGGVDLGSVFRAGATGTGGGSTLAMQLARQLSPNWEGEFSRWTRKVLEAGAARTLLNLHHGDYRALARSYLAVVTFGKAAGDIRGIAAAADAMFGIAPSALSPAQCALLVVLLPVRTDFVKTDTEASTSRWALRVEQARRLLHSSANSAYRVAATDLDQWPTLPRRELLPGLPLVATLNLGNRTRAVVMPQLGRIVADDPGLAPDVSAAQVDSPRGATP